MRWIVTWVFLQLAGKATCQLYDAQWVIGTPPSVLDFRNDTLTERVFPNNSLNFRFYLTSACICDEQGNLLFSCNGREIFDCNGDSLLSGQNLSPSPDSAYLYWDGISHGALFLPDPGSKRFYYLFHCSFDSVLQARPCKLYYSRLDKLGNFGRGGVIQKNVPILQNVLLRGGGIALTALDSAIVHDSLYFETFNEELVWRNRRYAYEKIRNNSYLLEEISDFRDFYNTMDTTVTAALVAVEEQIATALKLPDSVQQQYTGIILAKDSLFRTIMAIDSTIDSLSTDSVIQIWADTMAHFNRQIFLIDSQLHVLLQPYDTLRISALQSAATVNSAISPLLQIEYKNKKANELLLAKLLIGLDSFSTGQVSDLWALASLCPQQYGSAVFRARSLLAYFSDTIFGNNCDTAGYAYKTDGAEVNHTSKQISIKQPLKIRILPNPATDYLMIESSVEVEGATELLVMDNTGRVVKREAISLSTKQYKLNTQNLATGLYILKLMAQSGNMFTAKFNITGK